jgi:hypothetical protein
MSNPAGNLTTEHPKPHEKYIPILLGIQILYLLIPFLFSLSVFMRLCLDLHPLRIDFVID